MNYYSNFFKALEISSFSVSIPSLFFFYSYPINTSNSKSPEKLELSTPAISQANLSKDSMGKERLAERGDNVHLKPPKIYKHYTIFKDPWKWVLLFEEAQYFYLSGGSEWAG